MKNELRIITGSLSKAHPTDAGFDIEANENKIVEAHSSSIISTGLKIQLPHNTTGFVKSRSGLMFKKDIVIGEGVIDEDYIGEIKIKVFNMSDDFFIIKKNDRIAQLVILPLFSGEVTEISEDEIVETARGTKGFGSSGIEATL